MYFTTNQNVLESNDLVELRQLDIITDSQGVQCARMIYTLSPRKQYAIGEMPTHVHLTDGVTHRMLTLTGAPFEERRPDDPGSTQPNGQDSAGGSGGTQPNGQNPVGESGGFQTGIETTPRQVNATATGQASLGNQPLRAPLDGSGTAIATPGMPLDPGSGDPTRLATPVPAIPGTGPTPEMPILGSANGNPGNMAIPVVPGAPTNQTTTSAGSTPQPDAGNDTQPTTDSGGVLQTGGSGEGATPPRTDTTTHGTAGTTPALTTEDPAEKRSGTPGQATEDPTKTGGTSSSHGTADTIGVRPPATDKVDAPSATPHPTDAQGSTDTTHASLGDAHITDPLAGSTHETAPTSSDPVAAPVNPSDVTPPTTPTS